jgi:hypothetical protein
MGIPHTQLRLLFELSLQNPIPILGTLADVIFAKPNGMPLLLESALALFLSRVVGSTRRKFYLEQVLVAERLFLTMSRGHGLDAQQ